MKVILIITILIGLTGCGFTSGLTPSKSIGHASPCLIAWVGSTDDRGLITYETDCGIVFYLTDCYNVGDTVPYSLQSLIQQESLTISQL